MEILHDKKWVLKSNLPYYFDNRIMALYEISVASNVLYRLGNPIIKKNIIIKIDGYIDVNTKNLLENYLSETINYRTSIRYNCLTKSVKVVIICKNDYVKSSMNSILKSNECLLLFSKGLDSQLAYFLLKKRYRVYKISWIENGCLNEKHYEKVITDFSVINNNLYLDSFDNDPWDDYGLYFIYLVILLNKALLRGIKHISIGLNMDDLFGYDIISGIKLYSQCSQSYAFISLFKTICNYYNVNLLIPLENYTRVDVCKEIITNKIDIQTSISCVFYNKEECGACFSCFDKFTGLLIAFAELGQKDELFLKQNKESYILFHNNTQMMRFNNSIKEFISLEQLPIDYIMLLQINRILLGEKKSIILSSKYSVTNIIKVLSMYADHRIAKVLFPNSSKLFKSNKDKLLE